MNFMRPPYHDWFRSLNQEKGYIWVETKGRMVRKHFAVLDKLRGNWYFILFLSFVHKALTLWLYIFFILSL